MIESSVRDAGVKRIAQEIIHPVHAEGAARDHLREDRLPVREWAVLYFLGPTAIFATCSGSIFSAFHFFFELVGQDQFDGKSFMVPSRRKQLVLRRVREGKVSDIVAKRGHADDPSPVRLIHRCLVGRCHEPRHRGHSSGSVTTS